MKFLCLAYFNIEKFRALSKEQFSAIVSQCPAMDAELWKTGNMLLSSSLGEPEESVTIRPRAGKSIITDGPFAEAKEVAGGMFIIDADDMKQAIEVARLHPTARIGEEMDWALEIRPMDRFQHAGMK